MGVSAATESEAHYALPEAKTLQEAGELRVIDESRNEISFKSLWSGEQAHDRTLVVFIRHFFCGLCEDYVRTLSSALPEKSLSALSPPVKLVIIGCGQPEAVAEYKKRTQSTFPIYCDPNRKLYVKLGMTQKLQLGTKPDYTQTNVLTMSLKSAFNALTSGSNVWKGGDYSQNGGEWVFEDGELTWCRRMRNTRDHSEIVELQKVLKMA